LQGIFGKEKWTDRENFYKIKNNRVSVKGSKKIISRVGSVASFSSFPGGARGMKNKGQNGDVLPLCPSPLAGEGREGAKWILEAEG
jgi:hypothetical protein